jgi:hypothetical protein
MQIDYTTNLFGFQDLGQRKVMASFDGGMISSDAGALLLRGLALTTGSLRQFADCFSEARGKTIALRGELN